jgi:hypothetical protein
MKVKLALTLLVALAMVVGPAAYADVIPIGYVSWDVAFPGNSGAFDISNQTGPNSSGDATWPVTSTVDLSSLSLTVDFSNGSTTVFGSSYFALGLDGISFDGKPIAIGGTNPLPVDATLTGTFSPTTITLFDGSTPTINPTFSAVITPSSPPDLGDGDLAIINATTGVTSGVPEPSSWALFGTCLAGFAILQRKTWWGKVRAIFSGGKGGSVLGIVAIVACLMLLPPAATAATVHLNVATTPSNGVSGVTNVNVTGSGFPAGTIHPADVVVNFATSCGGAVLATEAATSVKTITGSSERVNVLIPAGLATGLYFVTIADSTAGDPNFTSGNCSEVQVTHTNATLSACLPTSSLGVLVPTKPGNVTAYVPNGCWSCGGSPGVQAVNIEGPTSATSIVTANTVNSCSSNPATNQTVCVANNTDVYLITGTTLNKTLKSGSNTTAFFSGGSCENCGVAINALSNTAVINMGLSGGASGNGVQLLDLNTNVFGTPFQSQNAVSEDISIDPTRNLILSANERANYVLYQIQSDGSTLKEFGNDQSGLPNSIGNFDSSAEDCSTGLALASEEAFPFAVFITDLTQAKLTPGSPAGTWTAPSTNFPLVTSYTFSAATDGIAVAPGSAHLAVITGEFGGNTFAVLQLPSTSGSGTPTILDYAVAQIPTTTACGTYSAGLDPHTVTAYTSPNNGKAYAVFANSPPPTCLVVIDLAAVLAAPRGGAGLDAHDVSAANLPAAAVTAFATH